MTKRAEDAGSFRLAKLLRRTQEPLVRRVLIVDDEEGIRTALSKFLRARGFEVVAVGSGEEALAAVFAGDRFVLMLCDIRMPGMSGVDLVPRVLEIDPSVAVVMLTAVDEATAATDVLAAGAMDYLMKPFEFSELETVLERNLHRRTLIVEQGNVERLIQEDVAARTDELLLERRAVQEMSVAVVEALINAQEAKDLYLRGHSQRVADLAASIARVLGLDDELVEDIRLAGRVHDAGRIGVRESVLNKPGPLTSEEFDHVKESVRLSMEILFPLKHLARVLPFIRDHQEHWDGSGYPRALAGPEITIGGRILHLANAYDAMTSARAFRAPRSSRDAMDVLSQLSGIQFDPEVVQAFRSVTQSRTSLLSNDTDSQGT